MKNIFDKSINIYTTQLKCMLWCCAHCGTCDRKIDGRPSKYWLLVTVSGVRHCVQGWPRAGCQHTPSKSMLMCQIMSYEKKKLLMWHKKGCAELKTRKTEVGQKNRTRIFGCLWLITRRNWKIIERNGRDCVKPWWP